MKQLSKVCTRGALKCISAGPTVVLTIHEDAMPTSQKAARKQQW